MVLSKILIEEKDILKRLELVTKKMDAIKMEKIKDSKYVLKINFLMQKMDHMWINYNEVKKMPVIKTGKTRVPIITELNEIILNLEIAKNQLVDIEKRLDDLIYEMAEKKLFDIKQYFKSLKIQKKSDWTIYKELGGSSKIIPLNNTFINITTLWYKVSYVTKVLR